jgi:hypothetical protein
MFRGQSKSKMSKDQFGIGSLIGGEGSDRWLVFGIHDGAVGLINLQTMLQEDGFVQVEDVNHISLDEARLIVQMTPLHWTFTDFDLYPDGMKNF